MPEAPSVRPLRIAAHNGAPEWGGAEIAVSRLLAGLQQRGHTVHLFCNRPLVQERAAAFGIETSRLHVGGDVALASSFQVARALKRFEAEVLLVGTFRKTLHLALGARAAGVPVVSRIGQSTDLPRNAKYRWLFRRAVDRVVVSASDVAAAYRAALPDLPDDRVVVVPKGIEVPDGVPDRSAARAALGLPEGAVVVGAVARLVREKRIDRFVEAVARVPGCIALIAGDGPEREALERQVRLIGEIDRIRFLGHVNDPWPIFAALDLLVISSERESMANIMMEALASAVPVISTPVSGARDVLVEGVDTAAPPGRVVADYGASGLGTALQRIVHDPALRRAMSAAALERARSRYSMDGYLDRWESELGMVVGG
ncbi:glycosyltransferase [Gemmatimonadota bacterium DH-20]|uniref:Glycosyltransferase n=1 Tax=Gaopeijia maritima TaxID=3119007 RepID=A0ABU9E417_9BACT